MAKEPYLAQGSIDCEYEAINQHSDMDPRPKKLRPEELDDWGEPIKASWDTGGWEDMGK